METITFLQNLNHNGDKGGGTCAVVVRQLELRVCIKQNGESRKRSLEDETCFIIDLTTLS